MYVDKELLLDDQLDIGSGLTSQVSTNTIDLGAAKNIAAGRPLYLVVVVDETFAGGTSVMFTIVTDTTANLATPTHHAQTIAILTADLTAGREPIVLPVGEIDADRERYLGVYYTIDGTFSAGKVTVFLSLDPQSNW